MLSPVPITKKIESMIPEASTNLIISEAIEDLIPSEAQSIEDYAEGLIDDLFTDIDNILDTDSKHPAKSLRAEYASMQAVALKMHKVVLPQTTVNQSVSSIPSVPYQPSSSLVFNPPTVTSIRKRNKRDTKGLSNLLILGTTVSMAVLGTMYFLESGLISGFQSNAHTNQLQSSVVVQTDPNLDLVKYMLSAIEVIDQTEPNRQLKNTLSTSNTVNTANAVSLPINSLNSNLAPPLPTYNFPSNSNRVTNVIERIYVPYSQSPPSVRSLSEATSMTNQDNSPNPAQTNSNNVQTANTPTPEKLTNTQLPNIAPPQLPTTATATPPTTSVPTTTQDIYLPAYSAELEGLMELGEKSAALFKMDGVTRRIKLGENIGSTGWTLVEVSNGEAIIRRNGEVRSIYTGQKL